MLYNFGKCKCLYRGHGNLDINYNMLNTVLGMKYEMKVSGQCGIAASKGNHILGLIRRNLPYKAKSYLYRG